jgi:CubicO group peptidase (beta-lactamase class C family)
MSDELALLRGRVNSIVSAPRSRLHRLAKSIMKRVAVIIIVLSCCAITEAQTLPAEFGGRVDALAHKMLSRPVAGISVAIARDGQVVFTRGYGMANLDHSVAVAPDTVFHIASISKNILTAVVLQLVDEGKLKLDDDITKYVPEAPTHGHTVTVRQLLNHTSGIYSFTSLPEAEANERLDLNHEQVLALFKDKPFDFEPGTAWRYDNSGFYLAGMIVERVTKQEYGAYVREHLFSPLGMKSAQMCDARMVVPHLASGYDRDKGALVNAAFMSWKLPFAAGAICATATDIVKWQAALDAGRVLSPSSLKLMRTPTRLADGTLIDYGLGTRLGDLEGHRVLGHTGGGGGFAAALESFPDDDLTVVVLVNTGNGATLPLSLAANIARLMLGLPEKKALRDLTVPQQELATMAPGSFNSDEGTVETFAREGKLFYRDQPTRAEGPLLRQSENVYALNENTEVRFVIRQGQATWAIVYTGGLMMDAVRRVK